MPHEENKFWNWPVRDEIFFAPAPAVGVRWSFLGHREWGFSLDREFIVYRDGVITWEMLGRRRDISVLAVENDPCGFHDLIPKLRQLGTGAKTFDMTWNFLKSVFEVSEEEMPRLPELLKQRYGEIAWHPYADSLNPERHPAADIPMEISNLDGGLPLHSRWEIRHWRCECGKRIVGFQKIPHWVYHSNAYRPQCSCGKTVQIRES